MAGLSGCVDNEEVKGIRMTFEEFANEFNQSMDNETKTIVYWFESLDDGDTLIIRDTINNTIYSEPVQYSSVEFVSSPGTSFPIEGNITGTFKKGETVEIELHIINTTFTMQYPSTGELWTFTVETFQEGWDNETHDYIPIPPECIRKVTSKI